MVECTPRLVLKLLRQPWLRRNLTLLHPLCMHPKQLHRKLKPLLSLLIHHLLPHQSKWIEPCERKDIFL